VWLHRVGEIISDLEGLSVPVLDRAVVERVFRLRRRGAIDLMNRFGAYQAGKSLIIDRLGLLASVQNLAGDEDVVREGRRRRRIVDVLDHMHRYRAAAAVTIRVQPAVFSAQLSGLPTGVDFGQRRLQIEYATGQELLQKLFELGQAIANDYDRFEEITR
jgi:hypothetical protein